MGKIKDRISEEIKNAMKAQNKDRLSVLRMVLSELKYAASAENVHADIGEEAELKVVSSYLKKLTKSRDEFPDENNKQKISAEIAIVEEFLPKRASEAEILAVVKEVIGSSQDKNFGSIMRACMAKLGASVDGKALSELIKKTLS